MSQRNWHFAKKLKPNQYTMHNILTTNCKYSGYFSTKRVFFDITPWRMLWKLQSFSKWLLIKNYFDFFFILFSRAQNYKHNLIFKNYYWFSKKLMNFNYYLYISASFVLSKFTMNSKYWSQFHQHFTCVFFIRKRIEQLFCYYVWLCDFCCQNFVQKRVCKMLMKLTTEKPTNKILVFILKYLQLPYFCLTKLLSPSIRVFKPPRCF